MYCKEMEKEKKKTQHSLVHTETSTKLSLALHLANLTIIQILLIPAYKLKLKQEIPVTRSIGKWSDDADAEIQDSFSFTDWDMFRDSSDSIEE